MRRFFKDGKYLHWGITAFLVIASSILFFMLLQHWPGIRAAIAKIIGVLSPIIWGFVISYLLHPVVSAFQMRVFEPLLGKIVKKDPERIPKMARAISVALSLLLLIIAIAALLWMMLPQLYESIVTLLDNFPGYARTVITWSENLLKDKPELEQIVGTYLGSISEALTTWVRDGILPRINGIVTSVTNGVYQVVRGVLNVLIGFIFSIYLMFSREKFRAGLKKLIYGVFGLKTADKMMRGIRFADNAFMGFISGKLIDSLIIGIICYIGCRILSMPYALLVSVIIGVTNIIPFFGPVIGAVPSAFLILMNSPLKCLIFVIFVIVLQQFDGNILGPKILGNRTGLNGFWVMFAIIVGGGLFGFGGMLLGVPIFTVILEAVRSLVNFALTKRGLSTEGALYVDLDHIDTQTGEYVQHHSADVIRQNNSVPGEDSGDAGTEDGSE